MGKTYTITKAAEFASLEAFRDKLDAICAEWKIDTETCYSLKLSVDEAITNVVEYGYVGLDPGSISMEVYVDPIRVIITITDFGHPFEPVDKGTPDVNVADIDDLPTHGFGINFIYQVMDEIDYRTSEDGNSLYLTKRLDLPT